MPRPPVRSVGARPEGLGRLCVAFLLTLTFLAALSAMARADEAEPAPSPTPEMVAEMQAVIAAQLDAFSAEDAEAAYAFAAPSIQRMFPHPSLFMRMVERGYAPVYAAQSFDFTGAAVTARGPAQTLDIVDGDGGVWSALYTFIELEDELRITGVYLRRQAEQQI